MSEVYWTITPYHLLILVWESFAMIDMTEEHLCNMAKK